MKIDHQSHFYNEYQTNLSHWGTDIWLKNHPWISKLGFRSEHIDTHPCIHDCIALLTLRMELWDRMNTSEQATWGAYWGIVFKSKKPLKPKAWNKFEIIAKNIDNRQLKIYILRQIATKQNQNKGHDMTAKGPDQPQSKLVKEDQLGGREDHQLLPWE